MPKEPAGFTAVAEATIGGRVHVSAPVSFTAAGALLIADLTHAGTGGVLRVLAVGPRTPRTAHFEKTFPDPAVFTIYVHGKPIQRMEVRNMYQANTLDLSKV